MLQHLFAELVASYVSTLDKAILAYPMFIAAYLSSMFLLCQFQEFPRVRIALMVVQVTT